MMMHFIIIAILSVNVCSLTFEETDLPDYSKAWQDIAISENGEVVVLVSYNSDNFKLLNRSNGLGWQNISYETSSNYYYMCASTSADGRFTVFGQVNGKILNISFLRSY